MPILDWVNKTQAVVVANAVPYHLLQQQSVHGDPAADNQLIQGLNRQIRLMAAAFGYRVKQLRRVRIVNVKLGALKLGQWRNLTEAELRGLLPNRTEW